MPPAMLDEIVQKLTPRLTNKYTNFRKSLEPGLQVAITIRHMALGTTYKNMQYDWRVPHNCISVIVTKLGVKDPH